MSFLEAHSFLVWQQYLIMLSHCRHMNSMAFCMLGSGALPSSFRLAINVWGPVLYQAHSGSPSTCGVECSTKLIQACHQHVGSSTLPSSFRLAISMWGPVLYQANSGSPSVCGVQCSTKLIQACHQCVGSSALSSSFRLGSSTLSSSFRLAISVWGPVLYQALSGLPSAYGLQCSYQAHSSSPSACEVQYSTKLIQARHQHMRSSTLSSSFMLGSSALPSSFRLGYSALSISFRLAISVWGPVLYQAHSGSGLVLY